MTPDQKRDTDHADATVSDSDRARRLEAARAEHIRREGSTHVNQHADGCWYCGSSMHHSTDCRDRDD